MSQVQGIGNTLEFSGVKVDKEGRASMQGKALGVDVQSAVDSMVEGLKKQTETNTKRIENINQKVKALSEIEVKTQSVLDSFSQFKGTDPYLGNNGIFSRYTARIPDGSMGNAVSISTTSRSYEHSFKLNVKQLATQDHVSATASLSNLKDDLGWKGSIGVGDHKVNVEGKSASQIMNDLNQIKEKTGFSAELIKVNDTDHRFSFTMNEIAKPLVFTNSVTGGDSSKQLPLSSTKTASDLSAKLTYQGVEIQSPSNNITSIPGLSLDLYQVTNKEFDVSLEKDRVSIKEAIVDSVNKYNDLQNTIARHNVLKTDGEVDEKSILFGHKVLNDLKSILGVSLAEGGNIGGKVQSLSDVGIKMETMSDIKLEDGTTAKVFGNKLSIDHDVLNDKLKNQLPDLERFFTFHYSSSDQNVSIARSPDLLSSEIQGKTFTVSLLKELDGALKAEFIGPDNKHYTADITYEGGNEVLISGANETIFRGLDIMISDLNNLANGATKTATLNAVQPGLSKLQGELKQAIANETGIFSLEKEKLREGKVKEEKQIEKINKNIEGKRESLLQSFQKMQQVVSEVLRLQNTLNSLTNPGAA